ncbi:tRNA epoxyqueuosine(34) reductase QueG [Paenibacillus sp. LHD-117]|uniref:tRNA epoxyqueuosine(34) reductase QueG n=1 Tax=Paenibacillus sp. LHD-117 TaxID=3071412 RepID=UPI0027DF0ED1|nr:tRNA epoxyqueuosine(34) reductase QueG [Paenibacillus sp. LHD-117]MDQ6423560.1 tRNA epoxyqueuosine(34) reductase QueG [Paenibacillus sp. LHD-117]
MADKWQKLKEEMKAAARSLGIDAIGIASADPFVTLKERLIRHRELGHESGFEEPDLDRRTDPSLLFDKPKSIIAIAVAYPSKLVDPPKSEPGARRGIMSRSAWGEDYHKVLRDRLAKLETWLRERVPKLRAESMVDTGALSDRAVAERAGLGWSAKNCSIISPELGSWIYLGEMITNLPLPPDEPVTEGCGSCTKCIDACPTGAIVGPGQLDAQRCISFVTQTKGMVSDEFMRKIGNRLYGCDTCQIVCPENRGKNWTTQPELQPDPELAKPLLIPLLRMGNKEFKARYGHTSSAWRGRKPIQRNAVIALGNFKETSAVPELIHVLTEDPRPVLRGTAAWSLGRIGGEQAEEALRQASRSEQDEEAGSAVLAALSAIQERREAIALGGDSEREKRGEENEHT